MPSAHEHPYRNVWTLVIGYAAFLIVSSLHPFRDWEPSQWSAAFLSAPLPPYITRTDISTNFLVYVPFGYMLALALARPRKRGGAVALASLAGLALSLALESLQQLVPARIASNLDVFLNTLGACTGAILSLHHQRFLRAFRKAHRWRVKWFLPGRWVDAGLALLLLWGLAQFSLLPVPGAGWLGLHLRSIDTSLGGLDKLNLAWFGAVTLEMLTLGAFTACLLRPGRYVSAMVLLFLLAFAIKLLTATILLKLRVVGGVLSLETLSGFLLAFWLLLNPFLSRRRVGLAAALLGVTLLARLALAEYLLLPKASLLNIMGLAKASASLWPYLALGVIWLVRLRAYGREQAHRPHPKPPAGTRHAAGKTSPIDADGNARTRRNAGDNHA